METLITSIPDRARFVSFVSILKFNGRTYDSNVEPECHSEVTSRSASPGNPEPILIVGAMSEVCVMFTYVLCKEIMPISFGDGFACSLSQNNIILLRRRGIFQDGIVSHWHSHEKWKGESGKGREPGSADALSRGSRQNRSKSKAKKGHPGWQQEQENITLH